MIYRQIAAVLLKSRGLTVAGADSAVSDRELLRRFADERDEKALEAKCQAPSGESLRRVRALEVLEQIGTREARQVLKTLTAGASGVYWPNEAQAALERLERADRR